MLTQKKPYSIKGEKIIIDYKAVFCDTSEQLLKSELFLDVVTRFIKKISLRQSSSYTFLKEALPGLNEEELPVIMVNLFRLLFGHTAQEVIEMKGEFRGLLSKTEMLIQFKEDLYNYWRRMERIIYIEISDLKRQKKSDINHAQFIGANENFRSLVLDTHRRIAQNLLGKSPRVYRQLPAGSNMGMMIKKIDWKCPGYLCRLKEVPFVRLTVIEPPLILYTRSNKRKGSFKEVMELPKVVNSINPDDWYCFPAKVGELTAFIYFHQDFSSMALSLCNLFEIAELEEIDGKTPDLIVLFGLGAEGFEGNTVFYEDRENGILTGLVKNTSEVDYFGYFKKMVLTLHNVEMINRGRLPVHGAMFCLSLKDGGKANVVMVGDSGAGKSETLEALRNLAGESISDMKVVFDDMGSLDINREGKVVGFGTEIGAFVRIDDLAPGYAYEEIDRSIFFNPHRKNARLVIPVTSYHHIIKGYPVDFFLYANNYECDDGCESFVKLMDNKEEAIGIFRNGARLAKGTTDEKGLVRTYFANPFGPPQRRQDHEKVAVRFFETMYKTGVKVGQIRTRLGIEGFEQEGPRAASIELFRVIKEHSKNVVKA